MSARVKLALTAGATVAICAAAPALAGLTFPDAQYEGRIAGDGHTYLGFDVKRAKGKRFVRNIRAATPIVCKNGWVGYLYLRVKGRIPVRKNRAFRATRTATGPAAGSNLRVTLSGRLGKGGKARGKIHAKGDVLVVIRQRGPVTTKCYTGVHKWADAPGRGSAAGLRLRHPARGQRPRAGLSSFLSDG